MQPDRRLGAQGWYVNHGRERTPVIRFCVCGAERLCHPPPQVAQAGWWPAAG